MKTLLVKYNSWIQVMALLVVAIVSTGGEDSENRSMKTRNTVVSALLAYVAVSFVGAITLEERLDSIQMSIADSHRMIEAWMSGVHQLLVGGKMAEIPQSESFNETLRLIQEARETIVHFSIGKGRPGSEDFYAKYLGSVLEKLSTISFRSFRRAGFFGDTARRRRFIKFANGVSDPILPKLRLYDLGKDSKTFLAINFLVIDRKRGIVVFTTLDGSHDKAFTVYDAAAEGFYSLFDNIVSQCEDITFKLRSPEVVD